MFILFAHKVMPNVTNIIKCAIFRDFIYILEKEMLFLHHICTNMSESIEKTIDIDKILASKMGAKVKYVPRFLVKWLKHIIHQD